PEALVVLFRELGVIGVGGLGGLGSGRYLDRTRQRKAFPGLVQHVSHPPAAPWGARFCPFLCGPDPAGFHAPAGSGLRTFRLCPAGAPVPGDARGSVRLFSPSYSPSAVRARGRECTKI